MKSPVQAQWFIVARWTLWFGAIFTIVTGLTGLYAYNTVAHDTPSHAAMTEHRNWALVTIVVFLALAAWSALAVKNKKTLGNYFVFLMLISGGLLGSTAWHGGEVVYRYGLGVMSLPKVEGEGHSHSHENESSHGHNSLDIHNEKEMKDFDMSEKSHNDDGHDHAH